jgi:4-amino-4-deoxy-L-arabinose transferase-like glycosyltransferase
MRYAIALSVVVIVCFIALQLSIVTHESVWSDEALYGWYATQLSQNVQSIASPMIWEFHPPFIPLLASPLTLFFPGVHSMRLISLFFGTMVLIAVFKLGLMWKDEWTGLVGMAMVAFNPLFFGTTHYGLLDTGFLFGVVVTAIGLLSQSKNHKISFLVIGMTIALLSKRAGFLVVAMVWIFLFPEWIKERFENYRKELFVILGYLALAILSIASFARERDVPVVGELIPQIFERGFTIIMTFAPFFLGIFFLIAIRPPQWKHGKLILTWIGVSSLVLLYPISNSRQWMPLLPILAILSAIGLVEIVRRIPISRVPVILFLLVSLAIPVLGVYHQIEKSTSFTGYVDEGEWLKNHADAGIIYDSKERETRYFSGIELEKWGGRIRPYPDSPEDFLLEVKKEKNPVFAIRMIWVNPFAPQYPTEAFLEENGFMEVASFYSKDPMITAIRIFRYEGI